MTNARWITNVNRASTDAHQRSNERAMAGTEPLRDLLIIKMVARLAMRWKAAGAYVPAGSKTVHHSGDLADDERATFDSYIRGYQDAIEDVMRHTDGAKAEPQPYAMSRAEASVFQGGKPAPEPRGRNTESEKSREARRKLENMFIGGAK